MIPMLGQKHKVEYKYIQYVKWTSVTGVAVLS